jgi:tellurite resistance protein TerC
VDVTAWAWTAPAAALAAVTVAEARLARRRGPDGTGTRAAGAWAGVYVSLAVLFGLGIAVAAGWAAAGQFYAGYLTEYSLSLDNLFVFWVIMRWFAVPPAHQQRVLLAGIVLALVLRSALILAGSAAISHFGWLFYPLGGILLWTAAGLLKSPQGGAPREPRSRLMSWLRQRAHQAGEDYSGPLVTWRSGRPAAGPVLLLAAAIGLADLLFAFDSIPALFGITTSAWLIVACNAFALSGLRQVYVLLTRVLDRIIYLNRGLAVICAFIGAKLLLQALRGSGAAWAPAVPAWLSLTVIGTVLLITVTAGAVIGRRAAGHPAGKPPGAAPLPAGTAPGSGERDVLLRRFAVFDIDGNGVWQRADYERLTRRLCGTFGHGADSAPAQAVAAGQRALFDALLAHMDADGDQQITPDEFTASVGRAIADRPGFDAAVRAAARALIQAADEDGNGVLDTGEYARLAGAYGASAGEAARAFAQLDLDRNGYLDSAELAAAISQFFASPDAAAPGNLAFGRL